LASVYLLTAVALNLSANTPEEATATLIQALKTSDTGLWYSQLSRTDVNSLHEIIGEYQKQEFEKERAYREKSLGKKIKDVYEYRGGGIALELGRYSDSESGNGIFDLFFIKDTTIWDGKYAEVTVFLPVMIRGVFPPIKLAFIKEKGNWKLCQALSSAYFMSGGGTGIGYDTFVGMYLDLFYGIKVNHADSSKTVKRNYKLSKEQSQKYYTAWKSIKNITSKDFLAIWILTGDKLAIQSWDQEKSSGEKTLTDKELAMYKGLLTGKLPNAQQQKRPAASEVEEYYQFISRAFFRDILAYRKFIEKFAHEKEWCAKAKYQIAENYEYVREYRLAEKAYLDFLKTYPDADNVVKGKANLAKIYWEKLGKQDDAVGVWKELESIGKLPQDVPYKSSGGIVPKTLLQYPGKEYMNGIMDFDIAPNGEWVDVLFNTTAPKKEGKEYAPTTSTLTRYFENGKSKEIFSHISGTENQDAWNNSTYRRIQERNNGIWLYTSGNGHALWLSREGKALKRLRDEGEMLVSVPLSGPVAPYPWGNDSGGEYAHSPFWRGVYFGDDSIYVYAGNGLALKKFDAITYKLLSKTIPSPEANLDNYTPTIAPAEGGNIFVVSPMDGLVFEYDEKGKVINKIRDNQTGVQFQSIRNVAFDKEGNMYAALEKTQEIATFTKDGKLIHLFSTEPMKPTSISIGVNGDIYVSGYGSQVDCASVTVYNQNGMIKTSFIVPRPQRTVFDGCVKDLAVTDAENIYVSVKREVMPVGSLNTRIESTIERYNSKGERLDFWTIPNDKKDARNYQESQMMLAPDPLRRKLYILQGMEVFEYAGPDTKKIADLTMPEKPYSPVKMITAFAADRKGRLRGYIRNIGVFSFNPEKASGNTVQLSTEGIKYGSQISPDKTGFDRDGNIWFCNYNSYGKTPSIEKYDLYGKEVFQTDEVPGTRSMWKPVDIKRSPTGELLIVDIENRRIAKYSTSGKYLGEFDLKPYVSNWAGRLRVDSKGRLYLLVNSMEQQMIVRFDGNLFH
jgi:hypothetical protein